MGLITPDYGLVIWMLITFGIVLFILKKFAWKPILAGLKSREDTISRALRQAEEAREEIAQMKAYNEELAEKSRLDLELALVQARQLRDKILEEAKAQAQADAKRLFERSREEIEREKEAAKKELTSLAASLAFSMAEKILRKEMLDTQASEAYIQKLIDEVSKN